MGYNNKSKRNWAEEYEAKQEEQRERQLNHRVNNLIQEIDNIRDTKEMITKLEEAIRTFQNLYNEGFEYNKEDEEYVNKKLAELKYKELEEKHKQKGGDHDSWEEFRKDEEDLER